MLDSFVTFLFLVLWLAVAFFALRFVARRYFHEPRRADVVALGIAVAFALGALWPFSARNGAESPGAHTAVATTAASGTTASQVIGVAVVGTAKPPGTRDISATCRGLKQPFGAGRYGAIDDLRSDEQPSTVVVNGGRVNKSLRYLVEGWAVQPGQLRPAAGVCLLIDGKVDAHARVFFGVARPDLATAFHTQGVTQSGYLIVVPVDMLTRGAHRIQVLSRISGGPVVLAAFRDVTVY